MHQFFIWIAVVLLTGLVLRISINIYRKLDIKDKEKELQEEKELGNLVPDISEKQINKNRKKINDFKNV